MKERAIDFSRERAKRADHYTRPDGHQHGRNAVTQEIHPWRRGTLQPVLGSSFIQRRVTERAKHRVIRT